MDYVTLANGNKVDWEEFSKWSSPKQVRNINPPNLGKDFGEKFKIKMSKIIRESFNNGSRKKTRNTGSANGFSRGVTTPLGDFESVRETALAFGVLPETIRKWILKKDDFNYIDEDVIQKPSIRKPSRASAKAVVTPYGQFKSMVDAATVEKIRVQTLRERVKNPNFPQYQLLNKPKI